MQTESFVTVVQRFTDPKDAEICASTWKNSLGEVSQNGGVVVEVHIQEFRRKEDEGVKDA